MALDFGIWIDYLQEHTIILFFLSLILLFLITNQILYIRSLKKQIESQKKENKNLTFKMQLQEKMLFLQSRQASLGELIGNVSHQWKEPLGGLGAILANLQATLLLKGEVTNEKLNDSIEKSYKIIYHLSDTIAVFYRFFRSQKSDKKEFNIYEEISNISLMVSYSMKAEEIFFKFSCDKDIIAYGDRSEFANVILNIILNAKDILIERKVNEPFIELKVIKEDENVIITIQDNGGGIYQEPIEKIFEYSISSKEDSTGIGLFIVKNIIENRMRGLITVQNNAFGALFTITLPITSNIIDNVSVLSYEVEESAYDKIARLEKEISKQKEVDKALMQWEDIFTQTHWGVAVHKGTNNHFEMINPAFCKMYGYSSKELKTMSVPDLFAEESLEILSLKQKEAFEKSFVSFETVHIRKDGSKFPVNIDLTVIKNEYDEILYHIANVRDITERKLVEENLLLKGFALNKISEAVFLIDENGKFQYVNEAACKSLGYSEDELISIGVPDIDSNVSIERFEILWENMKKVKTLSFDTFHTRKDGKTFPVEINSNYFEYQNSCYNLATVRNISERKEIEKRKEDEKMRLFFERQIVGMAITSPKEGWVQTNDKLCEMLGFSHEELSQINWMDITYPEDRERELEEFKKLFSGDIDDYMLEKRVIRKDMEIIYVNLAVSCVRHEDGSVDYILALIEDITVRKMTIEALHRSEELYKNSSNLLHSVMESSAEVTIFALDKEYKYLTFNELHKQFYKKKYGIDVALGKSFIELVPDKEFAKGAQNSWDRALSGESFSIVSEEGLVVNGVEIIEYWNNYVSPIFNDTKEITGLTCFSINITKRKEIERKLESLNVTLEQKVKERTLELQQAVDFNNGVINAIPDLMFEVDKKGTYINVWAKDEKLFATQKEILLGNNISDILSEEATIIAMEAIQEANENGLSFGKTLKINLQDGVHWFELSSSKKADDNFIFISRDVTERTVAQMKIEEEKEKFSKLFMSSPAAVSVTSIERNMYLEVNDSFLYFTKYARDEVVGKSSADLQLFANPEERAEFFRRVLEDGMVRGFEFEYRAKDGTTGFGVAYATLLTIQGERCVLAHSYDINATKQLELVTTSLNSTSEAIYITNEELSIIYVNEGACKMLGYTKEELTSMKLEEIEAQFSLDDIINFRESIKGTQQVMFETKHKTKDGKIIDVEIIGSTFVFNNQSVELSVVKDITALKKHETTIGELNKSLEQKVIDRTDELQKALEFNNSIIQAIPDMLFEISKDGVYLNIWTRDENLLTTQKDILLGKNLKDILPPVALDVSLKTMKEVDMYGSSLGNSYKLDLSDGERWFELHTTKKEPEGTYLALARDITERKKAQNALIELNNTLEEKVKQRTYDLQRALEWSEDIINTLPDLLFEMDEEGNYLNIWAQNKELLAQQKEALLGNNIYKVLSKEAADTIISAFEEANLTKVSVGKTIVIDLPDGKKQFGLSVSKKSDGNFLILSREISNS
ncbi:PAS domain S-box protein [Arcobacter sp. FWKO B]|uniref:PAS domain S-box protein n=1 Tax=Arcobacter sp. FWKO B TaxID=2593672 RepID=UPI0018A66FFA|nr:PAS domain S-box protein [Arcobacter sp. FWKO B]QOG12934.1 PAS domain S-box protein [Arcobacter sp. FWKO B]